MYHEEILGKDNWSNNNITIIELLSILKTEMEKKLNSSIIFTDFEERKIKNLIKECENWIEIKSDNIN